MTACLVCGRELRALGRHLRIAHGLSGRDYRIRFDLPASTPLADPDLSAASAARMRRLRDEGRVTNDHLPAAVDAARDAGRGKKCSADRARQQEIASAVGSANLRVAGPAAEQARTYQRQYRARRQRGEDDAEH